MEITQNGTRLNHKDRMAAEQAAKEFEVVREAVKQRERAKEDDLRARFEWGGAVARHLDNSEYGEDMAGLIAQKIDRTRQFVWNHARFHKRVLDSWPDLGIEGYIAECDHDDRNKSWRAARQWTSENDEDANTEAEAVDEQKRRVERGLERLEEEATKLWEVVQTAKGQLSDNKLEEVHGVLIASKQALDDTNPDDVPEIPRTRTENDAYREWVASHACCACGVVDDPIDPHHLDAVGVGTKGTDFLCVPLCRDCHDELDSIGMSEDRWWDEQPVNPYKVASELMAKILGTLNDLDNVLEVAR